MTAKSNTAKYVTLVALLGVVLGSFLVWARVEGFAITIDVHGTDSGKDGTITVVLALLAMPCIFFQEKKSWLVWVGIALAGLIVLVGLYDTLDISHLANDSEDFDVKVGLGLWLVDLASIIAVVAGYLSSRAAPRVAPPSIGTGTAA